MKIDTAIIPVAGLGTRMLPATKEQPKEMLPVPINTKKYGIVFKPFIQLIFEQLYDAGIRHFIFVVGRGKRIIEDHFTPDWSFIDYLAERGKHREALLLKEFYEKLESSTLVWVNQPQPLGFGDAVLRGARLVGKESFVVQAGDITLIDENGTPLQRTLLEVYSKHGSDALIAVTPVKDPRHYGVVIGELIKDEGFKIYKVKKVVEKPAKPISNLAITAIYIFNRKIITALQSTATRPYGELELTDAIEWLIEGEGLVEALILDNTLFIDIGRPETYLNAINILSRTIID